MSPSNIILLCPLDHGVIGCPACNAMLAIMELTEVSVLLSLLKRLEVVMRWGKAGYSPFLFPRAHCILWGKMLQIKYSLCFQSSDFGYRSHNKPPPKCGVFIISWGSVGRLGSAVWLFFFMWRQLGLQSPGNWTGLQSLQWLTHETGALVWKAGRLGHLWTSMAFSLSTMRPRVLLFSIFPTHMALPCGFCRVAGLPTRELRTHKRTKVKAHSTSTRSFCHILLTKASRRQAQV